MVGIRRLTPIAVLGFVIVGGARAASPPEEAFFQDGMRRLSGLQYQQAIADIFGDDIQTPGLTQTLERFDQTEWMAQAIAAQIVDDVHRAALVGCAPRDPALTDDACARRFVRRTGLLLFRRPLSAAEVEAQVAAAGTGARVTRDFHAGLAMSLAAMLMSPKFLFDVDVLERDPAQPGMTRLDAYSKASRLSLFLWNAPPDPVLLDAAARGALHTAQGLTQQVDRLIASPRFASRELAPRFAGGGQSLRETVRQIVTSKAFFAVPLAFRAGVHAVPR